MDKRYQLYAVTKTHWDREWYMDYQKTRIRLVHLIDQLLDILDTDPNFVSFMMDGQTLPLEDYLEVKPYNRSRLEKYIQQGRIVIGPWYILPDEILITGETHIRNYLLGTRVANSFGAAKMQVGYLPDSFGHPSQMPQILSKLGMDTIMFWRGATEEVDKTEFYWRAPDGTRVLTVLMPDGYFTGAELSSDPAIVAKRLDNYIENFARLSNTDKIYLSNGGDHLEPVPYLSRVLTEANALMTKGGVKHTTLENFVHDLRCSLGDGVKEIQGELCGVHYSILLASTLSTRMYLKQLNHTAARLLESYLEPMFAIAAQQGCEYPRDILLRAWKYFMENQPHDSICGCSVDAIHRDMLFRYNQVFEIGDYMFDVARDFYKGIDMSALGGDYALTVFNPTGRSRQDYIEAVVDFDHRSTSRNDYEHSGPDGHFPLHHVDNSPEAMKPLPKAVRAFDGDKELPCVLLDAQVANWLDLGYARFPHQYNVNRCRIGVLAQDIPPMGYKTLRIQPVYQDEPPQALGGAALENQFYQVSVGPDGSLRVVDKESGRVLEGLNLLADGGDCGDEYTYCPPDQDAIVCPDPASLSVEKTACNAVMQRLVIKGVLPLPEDVKDRNLCRSDRTLDCPFTCQVTLYPNIRRIDIKTTVENRCKHHRLRALFPTGVKAQDCWSAGTFSVDKRPVEPRIDPNWRELYFTHSQKDFCEANDGAFGVTVANRGLHEFEAYNQDGQTVLAITLLRCTGVISQRVIKTRKEMGGWSEPAPEGQCIGTWTFEYSVMPHSGTWVQAQTYLAAREYNVPMRSIQAPVAQGGSLPMTCSMVEIDNPALLVSAFKQCDFQDGYILRFYNSTDQQVQANIRIRFPFAHLYLANLREDTIGTPDMEGSVARMTVKPFEIVTLKILT